MLGFSQNSSVLYVWLEKYDWSASLSCQKPQNWLGFSAAKSED